MKDIDSATEGAKYVGLCVPTFLKLLHQGAIPARQIGRRWLVSRTAIDAFVSRNDDPKSANNAPEAA